MTLPPPAAHRINSLNSTLFFLWILSFTVWSPNTAGTFRNWILRRTRLLTWVRQLFSVINNAGRRIWWQLLSSSLPSQLRWHTLTKLSPPSEYCISTVFVDFIYPHLPELVCVRFLTLSTAWSVPRGFTCISVCSKASIPKNTPSTSGLELAAPTQLFSMSNMLLPRQGETLSRIRKHPLLQAPEM